MPPSLPLPAPDSPMLRLQGQPVIATGGIRDIYRHPEDPRWLVKVLHDRAVREHRSALRRWRIERQPLVRYRFLLAEHRAWLQVLMQQHQIAQLPPVGQLGGLISTDRGVGMLSAAVCNAQGELAPSLSRLWRDDPGNPELLDLLNACCDAFYRWDIRATDLKPDNLVLSESSAGRRLVLIDGLGDRNLIPMRTWSSRWNRRSLDRRWSRFAVGANLDWNAEQRRFALRPGARQRAASAD